jgi:dienelactone hydrolase
MKRFLQIITIISVGAVTCTSYLFGQKSDGDEWLNNPVNHRIFQTYLDFFSYDSNIDFAKTVLDIEDMEGLRREHITFQSTQEMKVTAHLYYQNKELLKDQPAIILLHGGVGKGKDAAYFVRHAQQLARAGFTIFAIDFFHFGERSTGLLTKFTEKDKHDNLYNRPSEYLSWIIQNVKDIGRAYDFLVSEEGIDKNHIALFGLSRGAQVSMIAGAVLKKFKTIILYCGGHFDAQEKKHSGAACPANYIGRISPIPLLMINGLYDHDYIKESSVDPLINLAGEPKKVIWTEGGHMFASEEDQAEIIKWLNKYLK